MNLAALSSTNKENNYAHNQSDRYYSNQDILNSKREKIGCCYIHPGVDIKHNSYDRYLAKKKSGHLMSKIPETKPHYSQLTGNKYYKLGLLANKKCECSK